MACAEVTVTGPRAGDQQDTAEGQKNDTQCSTAESGLTWVCGALLGEAERRQAMDQRGRRWRDGQRERWMQGGTEGRCGFGGGERDRNRESDEEREKDTETDTATRGRDGRMER